MTTLKTRQILARWCVVLPTTLAMACGGRGCGSRPSTSDSSALNGNQSSVAGLREPLAQASKELAAVLGIKPDAQISATDLSKLFDRGFTEIEETDRALARDTFEVAAVSQQLGSDRLKIFQWVRDNTYLVPYRGVLRGAVGVLMDRRGNSLDRAHLLAELLRRAGASVRFAHTTLSKDQVAILLRSARPMPVQPTVSAAVEVESGDAISTYATTRGVDATRLRAAVDRMAAASQSMAQTFQQSVARQAGEIAKALNEARDPNAMTPDAEVEALRDHWWVQEQKGTEWLDLDPTASDAAPGRTAVGPGEVVDLANLPEGLYHEVVIRIVVEQWTAGRTHESTALEQRLRPLDVVGQRIALRHIPLKWPSPMRLDANHPERQLDSLLVAQEEWLPIITVGSKLISRSSFTTSGVVLDKPGTVAKAPNSFGGLLDAFGGGAEPAAQPEGRLAAEWIEYEIRSPGSVPTRIRRDVFDLVGPTARSASLVPEPSSAGLPALQRALALLGETEILLLGSQLSPQFAQHVAYTGMLSHRQAIQTLLQDGDGASAERLVELAGSITPSSGDLYALALARGALSPVRDDVYLSRPNILSFHRTVRTNDQGQHALIRSFDIVANEVATRSTPGTESFTVRVTQGVVDTAAEALLIQGCGVCNPAENVSELWISAHAQGIPWVVIRNLNDAAWREVKVSDESRRRVENTVRAGFAVLTPTRPITIGDRATLGWWRIDPKSGDTLGVMESGQGQGMVEYVIGVAIPAAALITGVGVAQFLGCGGITKGISNTKLALCVGCGLASSAFMALAVIAFLANPLVGAGIAFVSETIMNVMCNLIDAFMV